MGRILRNLVRLEDAISLVAREIAISLNVEKVSIFNSLKRIAAKDIASPLDLPFFSRSVVDGYAVRAEDTYGATEYNPITLRVVGEVKPGMVDVVVGPGEAAKIYTGMPLPQGADAVIMFEDAIVDGNIVYVLKGVSKYANVAIQGEDIRQGKVLVNRGTIIEPKHIAALASVGINEIEVYEKISVCIICIGDEVIEPNSVSMKEVLARKLTYNSTGPLLFSFIKSLGFLEPVYLGIASDSREEIRARIEEAKNKCSIIVTTGGVGPSHQDITVDAVKDACGRIIVRGIAIRPGRPTSAGVIDGKPIFMLSGFPVAALMAFRFFVIPVLEEAFKLKIPKRFTIAKLSRRIPNVVGYTTFTRVRLRQCDEDLCAEPIASTGSGNISTILDGDGVLVIPDNVEGFEEGQYVNIELMF